MNTQPSRIVRKTNFLVPLSDLKTVRIVCNRNACGGVIELPVVNTAHVHTTKCPKCGDLFASVAGGESPYVRLAQVLGEFKHMAQHVGVEFVIPDDPLKS